MGVHQYMLGRELPCTVLELLRVRVTPLAGQTHDVLVQQVESGRAYPDVLYRLGLSHLARQELGLARQRLEQAVAQKPNYAAARLALAGVCDLLAQHTDAVDQIDAILAGELPAEIKTTKYQLLCAAGFCLERLGTTGAAVFRYEQALAHEQKDLFAHNRLAAIYLSHNQLEESIKHYRAILDIEPQEQAVRTSLAHVLQLLGRHKEAVWEYEKALCLDPENWDLQLELAEQFERMGNCDAAINQLEALCEKNPGFPDLHLRLANLHSKRGDDRLATDRYAEALSVHPNYLDGHIDAARHELKMGRGSRAVTHFQQALRINEQNVEAYAGLAVALQKAGNAEQAMEMLAAAQKIGRNSDVLIAQMGQLELDIDASAPGDNRQVIAKQLKHYDLILDERPEWSDVRIRQGMLFKLAGHWEDAARAFEAATTQNPAQVEAWTHLAMARRELGDIPGAMAALESAIQIKPQQAELHYKLALIYCSEMEFDLALEKLEQASALDNRQIWVALEGLQMAGRTRSAGTRMSETSAIAA